MDREKMYEQSKREIKDTVFTSLFSDKEYLMQLYQELHPEDTDITKEDLQPVTMENILVNQIQNDLRFIAKDKLLILVEAQSTYSINIAIRMLLYAVHTIKEYIKENKLNLHSSKQIKLPKPEFYVIYTGEIHKEQEIIKLSDTYKITDEYPKLELEIKVINKPKQGKIIWQYITFCKIINEQTKIYGRTKTAVKEAIKICTNDNILRNYLMSKEKEVVDFMTLLFSQEEVTNLLLKEAEEKGMEKGMEKEKLNMLQKLLKLNIDMKSIMEITGLDEKTIRSFIL